MTDEKHLDGDDVPKDVKAFESSNKLESSDTPTEYENENDDSPRITDHKAERSICFKLDIRLLPVLAIMCKLWSRLYFYLQ